MILFLFREHMPGLFRKRVNLDTYELPTVEPEHGILCQSLGGSLVHYEIVSKSKISQETQTLS